MHLYIYIFFYFFILRTRDLLISPKMTQRNFLFTLHPLSTVIFATATVLAFVLLRNSNFNFHCYTQREATSASPTTTTTTTTTLLMLSLNPDCLSFGKQDGTHPDEGRPGNRVDLAVMFASHVRTCTRFAMERQERHVIPFLQTRRLHRSVVCCSLPLTFAGVASPVVCCISIS